MTAPPAVRRTHPVTGTGSRLLADWHETGTATDLQAHLDRHGPQPRDTAPLLVDLADAAGLRGRGGAGFPTATKLRAVRDGRRHRAPVVVANGCESEPASAKDAALLALVPHLVVDGAVLAALAVGAGEVVVCVSDGSDAAAALPAALAGRDDPVPVRVVAVPHRFVSGQETALVRFLDGGPALPTTAPPRPTDRGVGGRPTLVDNVETLARLALVARHGPDRFRAEGTANLPGALLLTIGGAVEHPGVYEVPAGLPLGAALDLAGGPATPVGAVLTGGYGGTWVRVPNHLGMPLEHDAMRTAGAVLGPGVLLALPSDACGLTQTLHLLRFLARESARQCGPCRFGLPSIAGDLADIVDGSRDAVPAHRRLAGRLDVIAGRGACGHPDGAVRLAASALTTFADDVAMHLRGLPCPAAGARSLFPSGAPR